jgi:small subunit ribosomal protein S6
MPTYDVACISRKKASNKKMKRIVGRVAADLNKRGGVVRKIEHYGMRPLAYPIRRKGQKHETGRYFRMFVQASPQALKETLQTLRVDEDIIRFKPFKLHPNEMLDNTPKVPFTHKPKISEAHYDALSRTTNIDYYIARTLLSQGKMTPDEIKALGTHTIQFEPYFKSRELELKDLVFEEQQLSLDAMNGSGSDNDFGVDMDFSEVSELSGNESEPDLDLLRTQASTKSRQVMKSSEFDYLDLDTPQQARDKASV